MACCVCDARPSEGSVVLRRLNEKGVAGVWICDPCIERSPLLAEIVALRERVATLDWEVTVHARNTATATSNLADANIEAKHLRDQVASLTEALRVKEEHIRRQAIYYHERPVEGHEATTPREHRRGWETCRALPCIEARAALAVDPTTGRERAEAEPPAYDPAFGDDRLCECGHEYRRHFDTYDDMRPIGCKYCQCSEWAALAPESRG
jgi:hypothetical protein